MTISLFSKASSIELVSELLYLGLEANIFHLWGHRIYHHVLYLLCNTIYFCSSIWVIPIWFGLNVLVKSTAAGLSTVLLLIGRSRSHFASLSSMFHINVNFNA